MHTSLLFCFYIIAYYIYTMISFSGWYLVWTFFLSRFRFVRELTGNGMSESSSVNDLKNGRARIKKLRRD